MKFEVHVFTNVLDIYIYLSTHIFEEKKNYLSKISWKLEFILSNLCPQLGQGLSGVFVLVIHSLQSNFSSYICPI